MVPVALKVGPFSREEKSQPGRARASSTACAFVRRCGPVWGWELGVRLLCAVKQKKRSLFGKASNAELHFTSVTSKSSGTLCRVCAELGCSLGPGLGARWAGGNLRQRCRGPRRP